VANTTALYDMKLIMAFLQVLKFLSIAPPPPRFEFRDESEYERKIFFLLDPFVSKE
jgi:hypothetical protein